MQPPAVEHGDAVAHGHRLHLVVGHIEGGGAQAALQLHDLGAGAGAQLGVEVAERLIHQEHRRLAGDRPAQGHPLLLAAGEFLRPAFQQALQFQGGGHVGHPPLDRLLPIRADPQRRRPGAGGAVQAIQQLLGGRAGPAAAQPEADVVGHAQVGIERVALEHHRHIPLGGAQPAHGAIPHINLAAAGALQACQEPQQGALAAARGPHQHQELPIGDGEIQALQHLHRPIATPPGRVRLTHLLEANLSHGGSITEGS